MKRCVWVLAILLLMAACGGEKEKNTVEFEQFNVDESNNYRYIFRDLIRDEKDRKQKYKINEFR